MGTWGVNLYQDDTTLDVKDTYKDKLHRGKTNKEATEETIEENQDMLEDIEEASLFWFALAETQWRLGRLEEDVKEEALKCIEEGTDLERWKEDISLYERRKKVLEELKEKLLSPQPPEKKISKYRIYKCEWKIGDVFAYKLKSEYAKQNQLENKYLIIQKVDERIWWPEHTIPIVRVKITENDIIPKTEEEINKLKYIQTSTCFFRDRFAGSSAIIPLEEQIKGMSFETDEYGLLPEYQLTIIVTSKSAANKFKEELIYLGNYTNIKPPKIEFIPITKMNLNTIRWQDLETELIDSYLLHNMRQSPIYKKEQRN